MFPILLLPSRRRCSDSDSDNKASHSRPPIRLRCRRKELLKSEPEWGAIRLFKPRGGLLLVRYLECGRPKCEVVMVVVNEVIVVLVLIVLIEFGIGGLRRRTSSWGGAGWCGRTCACGSWWHEEGDERSTCGCFESVSISVGGCLRSLRFGRGSSGRHTKSSCRS